MSDVKGQLTPCKEAFPAERIRPRTVFVTPRTGQEDAAESPEGLGILISLSLSPPSSAMSRNQMGALEREFALTKSQAGDPLSHTVNPKWPYP